MFKITTIKYTAISCILLELVGIILQTKDINIEPEYIFYYAGFVLLFYSIGLSKVIKNDKSNGKVK